MAIIEWRKEGTVAILIMNTEKNRQNPTFLAAMHHTLDEIEADQEIKAIVITSSDQKVWSMGADVDWLTGAFAGGDHQSIKDFMYANNKMLSRILTLPVPVIAAIGGHVFGNGTVLACACDFRFMRSDRGYFCFPEVDINIPFLPGMIGMLKRAIPYYKLDELVYTGKKATGKELEEHRIVIRACEGDDELMKEALAFAQTFVKGRSIFKELKARFHKPILEIMEKEDPPYIESLQLIVS